MPHPQQPELDRSGHTPVDQDSWQDEIERPATDDRRRGPVPEENRPGHHPEHEQDKPERPPPA